MRVSPLSALLLGAVVPAFCADFGFHFDKSPDRAAAAAQSAPAAPACGEATTPHKYDGKKGFGLASGDGGQDTDRILKLLGARWHYNWSNHRAEPSDVAFVPMVYDAKPENKAANVDAIKAAQSDVVLGFNEPDIANKVTVENGIKAWPWIEDAVGKGTRLGSPAEGGGAIEGDPDHSWVVRFVEGGAGRVDFVAVHYYRGPDEAKFEKFLTTVHERFCRPVWVTEYGLGDWDAGTANPADAAEEKRYGEKILPICTGEQLQRIYSGDRKVPSCVDLRKKRARNPNSGGSNRYTIDQAADFMRASMAFMDKTDWIERYSWWSPASGKVWPETSTNLLWYRDASGQVRLTRLGEVYAEGK